MFNWQKSLTLALVLTTIAGLAMLAGDSTPSPSGFTWGSPVGMNSPRSNACPAALPDGRILISGGAGTNGPLASAEIYGFDGRFEIAASMTEARSGHGCAVLPDGKILVAGGWVSGGGVTNGVEIYDPEANAWTAGPPLLTARAGATVSVLPDGRLLIAGGESAAGPTDGLEIFDPRLGKFQAVAGRLTSPRTAHAAAVLADGRVVIAGGTDGVRALDAIDVRGQRHAPRGPELVDPGGLEAELDQPGVDRQRPADRLVVGRQVGREPSHDLAEDGLADRHSSRSSGYGAT
jgi:hypothetical protein